MIYLLKAMPRRILISNMGFGDAAPQTLKLLKQVALVSENLERIRFTEKDFLERIEGIEVLIAGTEQITKTVLDHATHLKLIARVGVGVDNINLDVARQKKINICYTPDAPSDSVAEFTLALILSLLKRVGEANISMHRKNWYRPMGRMLSSCVIGIIGAGKIGTKVIDLVHSISPMSPILFYDPYVDFVPYAKKTELKELLIISDILSLHLPITQSTNKIINTDSLKILKKGSYLVNTSRGSVIDEKALYDSLKAKHLAGAALDVFGEEPYNGILTELDNCILTSHIGSMTQEVRMLMENQVIEDVMRYLNNQPLLRPLKEFNFAK